MSSIRPTHHTVYFLFSVSWLCSVLQVCVDNPPSCLEWVSARCSFRDLFLGYLCFCSHCTICLLWEMRPRGSMEFSLWWLIQIITKSSQLVWLGSYLTEKIIFRPHLNPEVHSVMHSFVNTISPWELDYWEHYSSSSSPTALILNSLLEQCLSTCGLLLPWCSISNIVNII